MGKIEEKGNQEGTRQRRKESLLSWSGRPGDKGYSRVVRDRGQRKMRGEKWRY